MTGPAVWTYNDYAAMPDDGKRYEIHDGVLTLIPASTTYHQMVLGDLATVLDDHVKSRRLGLVLFAPLDVILTDTTVLQPDILYMDPERRRAALTERAMEGPPTLVIEILRTSDRNERPHDEACSLRAVSRAQPLGRRPHDAHCRIVRSSLRRICRGRSRLRNRADRSAAVHGTRARAGFALAAARPLAAARDRAVSRAPAALSLRPE